MPQVLVVLAIVTAVGIFVAVRRQVFVQPRHAREGSQS